MTMANSVELRVPLLDHNVLEFAAQLPRNQKVRGWTMKYLAKRALRNHIPHEILYRRKAGFPVPYESWLQTELRSWVADVLLDRKFLSRGYFQKGVIQTLVQQNRGNGKYAKEIFSLLVLELWHQKFADQGVSASSSMPALASVGK
jgi:asparagine synthase (glutamine-hydrolysing)